MSWVSLGNLDVAAGYTMHLNASTIEMWLHADVANENNDNRSGACLHFIFLPVLRALFTGQETHLFSMTKLVPCLTEMLSFK